MAPEKDIIAAIRSIARFGVKYATDKCNAIKKAAQEAKLFGHVVNSNHTRILI